MGKRVTALTTILVIIFLMEPMLTVDLAQANMVHAPSVDIASPNASLYGVYHNTTILLEIYVGYLLPVSTSPPITNPEIANISYSLDDAANVTLTNFEVLNGVYGYVNLWVNSTLYNLNEGDHTLYAYAFYPHGGAISTRTIFTVDITPPYPTPAYINPTMSMISPLNQTYNTNEIPLTYTLSGQIIWSYYSIDDYPPNHHTQPQSFNGNITLPNLSDGSHKIKITVATDRGSSQQITYFSIDTGKTETPSTLNPTATSNPTATLNATSTLNSTTNSSPTPTIVEFSSWTTLLMLSVMLVVVGLVYFKKRKRGLVGVRIVH